MLNIYSEIFEFDDHEKTSVNMGENDENELEKKRDKDLARDRLYLFICGLLSLSA